MSDRARWAAVVVNYEAGALLDRRASRRCSPTTQRRTAPRSSSSTTARADGSVAALRAALPDVPRACAARRTSATRAPPTSGSRRPRAGRRGAATPTLELAAGRRGRDARARSTPTPRLAAVGPRMLNPDGTDYPSARAAPGARRRGRARAARPRRGRRTGSPVAYRQLDADPDRPARRRLGLGRGALAPPRRARRRRRLGRALLHVHRGRRPVLAAAARAAGAVAYEPAGAVVHVAGREHGSQRPYRMIAEHHRSACRFARRAVPRRARRSCCRSRPCSWLLRCRRGDGRGTPWGAAETPDGSPANLRSRHGQGRLAQNAARTVPESDAQVAAATSDGTAAGGRRRRSPGSSPSASC